MAVKMLILVFWVIMPFGHACNYQLFRKIYCLHLSPDDGNGVFFESIGICIK